MRKVSEKQDGEEVRMYERRYTRLPWNSGLGAVTSANVVQAIEREEKYEDGARRDLYNITHRMTCL